MQYDETFLGKIGLAKRRERLLNKFLAYIFLAIGGITMVLPFLWMLTTSLKSHSSIFIFRMSDIQ